MAPVGDIEVAIREISLPAGIATVQVLYVEYPKGRHKKGMSLRDFRRGSRVLHPLVVRTGPDSIRVVLDAAPDGIYDFRAVTGAGSVQGSCQLFLFGRSTRRRLVPLGQRRLEESRSIVKILMPEGLLWEDDKAFDGTMEDADSTTKFQSSTGIIWKEYR